MKKDLEQWQMTYILANHTEKTAPQMAVAIYATLKQVEDFCRDNNLEMQKLPFVKKKFGEVKRAKTIFEPPKKNQRPPAEYGNLPSPYGIATEMRQQAGVS